MAFEYLVNATNDSSILISQAGNILGWLQAIGIVFLLWLIFNVVALLVNLKRRKELIEIRREVRLLRKKFDLFLMKKR